MKRVEAALGYLQTGVGFCKTLLISRDQIKLNNEVLKKILRRIYLEFNVSFDLYAFLAGMGEWEIHSVVVRACKNVFTFIDFPVC